MNGQRFDRIMAALGRAASRRRTLALLGVAALGGLGGERAAAQGAGPPSEGAAQTAQRKHRRHTRRACRPGKRLAFVVVPPGGEAIVTPPLVKGQPYNLRATGFWLTNATTGNDAVAAFSLDDPFSPVFTFQGVRLGLSVNDRSPDDWGSYNSNHMYAMQVIGRGRPLTMRFTDPAPQDNSSTVEVEITCADTPPAAASGTGRRAKRSA